MPTERFHCLPEEKRQAIRTAAVLEFARVPYEKVSINQIIHNAEISRGSFYTYFVDKKDLLEYILSDGFENMLQMCEEELEANGGDYFALLEWLFQWLVDEHQETRIMMDVVRNVFSSQEGETLFGMDGGMFQTRHSGRLKNVKMNQWIFERLDRSRYPYKKPEEFDSLLRMGMMTMSFSVKWYVQNMEKAEEAKKNFRDDLELLKYGAYQNKN